MNEKNIVYTALFVQDVRSLLEQFAPKHAITYGHHSTIAFKPKNLAGIEIGKTSMILIIGRASDERGDALLVRNPRSNNEIPHITLSCADGVKPFYSNELLKKSLADGGVERFSEPIEIEVVEGYFDGKTKVIS